MRSLMSALSTLKLKDFALKENNLWSISRAVTKNPLTITLYGSGEKGIGWQSREGQAMTEIYQRLSDANEAMIADRNLTLADAMFGEVASETITAQDRLNQFERQLNDLITKQAYMRKGKLLVKNSGVGGIRLNSIDRQSFSFSPDMIEIMEENMRVLVVKEMTQAIEDTQKRDRCLAEPSQGDAGAGDILQNAFEREYRKALDKKPEGAFLSQNEVDAILDSLSYLAPQIRTDQQFFDIAGSDRSDVDDREFGKAFNGSFQSSASINGPSDPGVSAIPTLVIGMGDGYMMQYMANMANAVAGGR